MLAMRPGKISQSLMAAGVLAAAAFLALYFPKPRQQLLSLLVIALIGGTAGVRAQGAVVAPESVGFSANGLRALQRTMRALVDDGKLAGVTTLVARHGSGRRLLKSSTVELMRTNVLGEGIQVDLFGAGMPGIGFGLDFAIVMDPVAANTPEGRHSFYWGGAFGTWFWTDPTNDVLWWG
jgi:CubicO group peptidase (beta-lactamase class C family)